MIPTFIPLLDIIPPVYLISVSCSLSLLLSYTVYYKLYFVFLINFIFVLLAVHIVEFGVHLAELTVDPQGALAIRQVSGGKKPKQTSFAQTAFVTLLILIFVVYDLNYMYYWCAT